MADRSCTGVPIDVRTDRVPGQRSAHIIWSCVMPPVASAPSIASSPALWYLTNVRPSGRPPYW